MELLTALLIAGALLVLLWCLTGLILFPVCAEDTTLIWRLAEPCLQPEYRLRGYLWLLHSGLCGAKLWLVDCGLSQENRQCIERLIANEPAVEWKNDWNLVQEDGAGT